MRLFSLLYIAASHTVHVHYFSCVLLVVILLYIYIYINTLSLIFSQLTLKTSENVAKRSEIGSEKSDILPKSYLLLLFIIIVKARVVPTKTD